MVSTYKRKKPPIDKKTLAKAIEAVKNGQSLYAAAKTFGLNRETLRQRVGADGGSVKKAKHSSHVNAERLRAAIERVKSGNSIIAVAKEFGIANATLRGYIVREPNTQQFVQRRVSDSIDALLLFLIFSTDSCCFLTDFQ